MQPISWTSLSYKTETLYPLNTSSFPPPSSFSFCLWFLSSLNLIFLGVNLLVFSLLVFLWASWMSGLLSVINFGNFSAFIKYFKYFFYPFLSFNSLGMPMTYITPFVIGPQSLDILFCFSFFFFFVFVLFAFQFLRILLIDLLAQRFLRHVQCTKSIKGILHFCYSGFHLRHFFLVLFRISISLLTLTICFCMLSTLSIRDISILVSFV